MKKSVTNSRRNFITSSISAAAGLAILPANIVVPSESAPSSYPSGQPEENGKVLFSFDDHSIPWQHNLKLTLVEAEKYKGNPVLKTGAAGSPDYGHAILYGSVIKVGDTYKMWYLAMHENVIVKGQAPGNWRPMCYAESKDGIHWTKPNLGLVEFNGNKNNNICLIQSPTFSLTRVNDFLSVLYEPDDPNPGHRYKVAYIAHVPAGDIKGGLSDVGHKEKTPCMTICATSADGLTWNVVNDAPANAGGERFEVTSLYKFGDFYYSAGQLLSPWAWLPDGKDTGRVMMIYRSSDFKNWSKAKAFGFARAGQLTSTPVKGQQTHMGAGMWNRQNVMLGLYGIWQDGLPASERPPGASHLLGTHVDLGLLISNDGIHFREPVPDFKIIARGKQGEWDDVALLQGHAFVNEGDKTMIWYSHWDTSAKLKSMEIGLATLRRDGFGFLSAKELKSDAHCITSNLSVDKNSGLFLNVDGLSESNDLRVEIVDHLDKPISVYSGKNSARIVQNGTKVKVEWPNGKKLPKNTKFAVRINFPKGSDAKLYSIYLERI